MYQPPQHQVVKRGANHVLHIILTFLTCGLWLPVWGIAAIMGRKTVTEVRPYGVPQQYPPQVYQAPPGSYGPPPQYGQPQLPPSAAPSYGYPQQPPYPPQQ